MTNSLKLALTDIHDGIVNWRIWLLLGWQDIRIRYRRSILGPLWITLSMAITIYSMGFLYGKLFHMNLAEYYPLLASGMLSWTLIATITNESTNCFIEAAAYLKQIKLPYSIFIFRIITRNIIIFLHNCLTLIPIFIIFRVNPGLSVFVSLFGLIAIAINGVTYGLILGMLGSRFRDTPQIIQSLVQVIFFVTPIIWSPNIIPSQYQYLVAFNPFAQFIALIREPLLGHHLSSFNIIFTVSFTVFGIALMLIALSRARHRIIFWL